MPYRVNRWFDHLGTEHKQASFYTSMRRLQTTPHYYNKCKCGYVGRALLRQHDKDWYWTCCMCLTMKRYPK